MSNTGYGFPGREDRVLRLRDSKESVIGKQEKSNLRVESLLGEAGEGGLLQRKTYVSGCIFQAMERKVK